jgi:sugar/nucleoside kinase (ribokinase family)
MKLGLDGKPLAESTSHPWKVPKPPAKRATAAKPTAAQADRHRALVAQGLVVKRGANGATVFSFSGGYRP